MSVSVQSVMDALAGVAYAVDLDGRILSIGRRGWRLFAMENHAVELADPDKLIGRNLFDFILGEDVRAAYARMLERIRLGEPQITVPCRCDAPDITRDMHMTVTPLKRGRSIHAYLFQCISLSEHTRPPIALFEFARAREGAPLLSMCSMCERVCQAFEDGCADPAPWMEAERYYAHGGSSVVRISHTVCPQCFRHWVQGMTGRPPDGS
jgi:hypothetical protein